MTHDDVHALASEYVLGQLDQVTRTRLVQHLATCPACAEEVRQVSLVLDLVGRSAPEVTPPASLASRIAGIPDRVPQLPAAAPLPDTGTRPAPRVAPWFAAIAASLVAAVAIWQAVSARTEIQRLRSELAQMQVRADDALVAQSSLERRLGEFTKIAGILRASDVVSYSLSGSGGAASARARAFVTHQNGMVFTAQGLPALPAGKVYQLWVIVGAKPVSVGTFSPDTDGNVQAVLDTPVIDGMPGAVAVTIEPTGGLPAPSTTPILVGTAAPQ